MRNNYKYPKSRWFMLGLFMFLVGQISGIIMVTLMSIKNNLYLNGMMKVFVLLAIAAFIAVLFIKESDNKLPRRIRGIKLSLLCKQPDFPIRLGRRIKPYILVRQSEREGGLKTMIQKNNCKI